MGGVICAAVILVLTAAPIYVSLIPVVLIHFALFDPEPSEQPGEAEAATGRHSQGTQPRSASSLGWQPKPR